MYISVAGSNCLKEFIPAKLWYKYMCIRHMGIHFLILLNKGDIYDQQAT